MPPQVVSFRPQTSRQARRAYQKAGGSPRLSAVELRRLERSAELEERAARIRAHNARAKENKRKKAEKLEKERQTRKHMGILEPAKIKLGSSQLSLGAFMDAGTKANREEVNIPRAYMEGEKVEKVTNSCPSPVRPSANTDSLHQPKLEQQQSKCPRPLSSSQRPVSHHVSPPTREDNGAIIASSASLMPPPPPRPPLWKTSAYTMAQSNPKLQKSETSSMTESDWDSLFDSNTQVEREISHHIETPSASNPPLQLIPNALTTPP